MFYVYSEGYENCTEILDFSDEENDVTKNVRKENGVTFERLWV